MKRYELYLKKSLEALRKIGRELSTHSAKAAAMSHRKSQHKQQKSSSDNPMVISDFEKDFYKDSVNILGVSMDELEEFMNPSLSHSIMEKNSEN